jgi:hypothetical protein
MNDQGCGGEIEEKRPLARSRTRWKNNVTRRMNLTILYVVLKVENT